jgi:hypothetical protein
LCVYGEGLPVPPDFVLPLPPNVCENVVGYVGLVAASETPAQRQCLVDRLNFLCETVSQQQSFGGVDVVAHILDPTDQAAFGVIGQITNECVNANVPSGLPQPQAHQMAQNVAGALFSFNFCDNNAGLLTTQQVISSGNSTPTMQPQVQPGTCM